MLSGHRGFRRWRCEADGPGWGFLPGKRWARPPCDDRLPTSRGLSPFDLFRAISVPQRDVTRWIEFDHRRFLQEHRLGKVFGLSADQLLNQVEFVVSKHPKTEQKHNQHRGDDPGQGILMKDGGDGGSRAGRQAYSTRRSPGTCHKSPAFSRQQDVVNMLAVAQEPEVFPSVYGALPP